MTSPVLNESRWSGEFLISEARGTRSRQQITMLQQAYTPPQVYTPAGTIVGVTGPSTGAPVYAANSGNTGNFTCSAVTEGAGTLVGVYKGEFIAATIFNLYDPNGVFVGEGHTGTAFAGEGLGFTITAGGTAAVAGDGFTITVAANANAGLYAPLNLAATDGTQNAAGILFNTMDLSQANTKATIIAREAEVNQSELTYPSGASASQIAAINAQLAAAGIQIFTR